MSRIRLFYTSTLTKTTILVPKMRVSRPQSLNGLSQTWVQLVEISKIYQNMTYITNLQVGELHKKWSTMLHLQPHASTVHFKCIFFPTTD